jgi:hypothetical protein
MSFRILYRTHDALAIDKLEMKSFHPLFFPFIPTILLTKQSSSR